MKPNWQYLILAFAMAVFCWYLVTGQEKVDTWMTMRVEMTSMPAGLYIKSGMVGSVDVLVRGPRGVVRKIEENQLVYTLNLGKIVPGRNVIVVDPKNIPLPGVYEVVEIRPSRLELAVERRAAKTVPVKVALRSALPEGYALSGARAVPDSVKLAGPAAKLEKISEIRTQPIALASPLPTRFEDQVSLDVPDEVDATPTTVRVSMAFVGKESEITLKKPITVHKPHGREVEIIPKSVTLRVRGPAAIVTDKAFPGLVEARLDLKTDIAPGRYEAAYRVKMPRGCELIEARPEKVALTVK